MSAKSEDAKERQRLASNRIHAEKRDLDRRMGKKGIRIALSDEALAAINAFKAQYKLPTKEAAVEQMARLWKRENKQS